MKKYISIFCSVLLLSVFSAKADNAPITTAGRITTATPGTSVPVNVTVTGFTDIGQFTLTMDFDTVKLHFVSATPNPSLTGMTVTYTHPSGNTQGKLIFSWTGSGNFSLSDGSSIAGLVFSYISGTGLLVWDYSYGSVCIYERYVGGVLTTLNDNPQYLFYLNGGISNRGAPITMAPVISNPVPGSMPLSITVNAFTNIGALTLWMEYDPAVITYQNTFTKNPAFGSSFQVGDNAGFGNKRLIVIQWYGGPVTLSNGSILCTLNFSYPSPNCSPCALSWFDSGPSCEYVDGSGDVLIDMPQSSYYMNGNVAEGLFCTWTGSVSSAWDNVSNWNSCGIPDITRQVIIPNVSPNSYPVITVSASCKTIKIQSGATVIVGPTGTLNLGAN